MPTPQAEMNNALQTLMQDHPMTAPKPGTGQRSSRLKAALMHKGNRQLAAVGAKPMARMTGKGRRLQAAMSKG